MYDLYVDVKGGIDMIAERFKTFSLGQGERMLDDLESNLKSKLGDLSKMSDSPQKGNTPGSITAKAKDVINSTNYVQELIKFHRGFEQLIQKSFENSTVFRNSLRSAFEMFINRDILGVNVGEILAVYTDKIL